MGRARVRVEAALLALALALGGVSAHAECTKDLDCPGEQLCESGSCVEPPAPSPPATPTATSAPAPTPAPSLASPPAPRFERRSPVALALGGVASGVGLIGIGVGLASHETTCYRDLADDFMKEHCEEHQNTAAYIIGGVLLVGGVTAMIVGGMKVPVKSEASLTPWVSPQGGGLSLRLSL